MCNVAFKAVLIALALTACTNNEGSSSNNMSLEQESRGASKMLDDAQAALDVHDFDKALALTDSLHKAFPGATQQRHSANHLHAIALEGSIVNKMDSTFAAMTTLQEKLDSMATTLEESNAAAIDRYVAMGQELRRLSIEHQKLDRQLQAARAQIARTLPDE